MRTHMEPSTRPRASVVRGVATLLALLALVACGQDTTSEDPGLDPEPGEPDEAADAEPATPGEPDDDPMDDGAEDAGEDGPSGANGEDDQEATDRAPDLSVELTLTEVASMGSPIAGAVGPDGTLYLAERDGTVHPLVDGSLGDAVVDVSAETTTDGERGLLGLAFAADGGELFLSFTDSSGDSVIEAFRVDDGVVVEDQRRTVLTLAQPYGNHNGGDVQLGPDGYLYVGFGDGGGGGDPLEAGQDTSTLLGAMLRIDPSEDPYAVPADNPFVDDAAAADEIWAYGLRNPWRFSFDRETGDLWIADVGQSSREEINWMPAGDGAGANYGWNLMEGTLEFAGAEPGDHVSPVHEYDTGSRCSITGGYVYRGEAIPELQGAYLFSDYCEAVVRAIHLDDGEVVAEAELGIGGSSIASFAQDAAGELYVLDLGGAVSRIDPA